jgi:2-hydroxymuconate-semialdehyde hydrolase
MAEVEQTLVKHGRFSSWLNRAGRGHPESILFLHGSGPGASAWSNWLYALPAFGERYDSLAPDWIGFGKSTHPDPPPDKLSTWLRVWLDQITDLLDALAIRKSHLVGNSLGGVLALHAVAEHPERFGKVVLMGPGGVPIPLAPELDMAWGFYDDPSVARMGRLIRYFAFDESIIGDRFDEIARMRFEAAMQPEVRRSYATMFPAPRQRHVDGLVVPPGDLQRIRNPTLRVQPPTAAKPGGEGPAPRIRPLSSLGSGRVPGEFSPFVDELSGVRGLAVPPEEKRGHSVMHARSSLCPRCPARSPRNSISARPRGDSGRSR